MSDLTPARGGPMITAPCKGGQAETGGGYTYELVDPHILWANYGRFTLPGFERVRNDAGELVRYTQYLILPPYNQTQPIV